MKKVFKIFAMTLVMALTVTTMAFADNAAAKKLQEKLRSLGVADTYIGATVEYLQRVQISDAQLQAVAAALSAKAIVVTVKAITNVIANVLNTFFILFIPFQFFYY